MQPTEFSVEIIPNIRPNLPSVLATVVVTIELPAGPMRINDCRILQNKNHVYWFSLPTFSINLGGRQFEYRQSVELPVELAQRISARAIEEFLAWQAAQKAVRP